MTVEKDRGLVRKAIREWSGRWRGVDDALKSAIVEDLKDARVDAASIQDVEKRVNARVSIAKTVIAMEGQNQADEHLAHKTGDTGTERHQLEVVYVNKPAPALEESKPA